MNKSEYGLTAIEVRIYNNALSVARDSGLTPEFLHKTDELDHFIVSTSEGACLFVDAYKKTWRVATEKEEDFCHAWEQHRTEDAMFLISMVPIILGTVLLFSLCW